MSRILSDGRSRSACSSSTARAISARAASGASHHGDPLGFVPSEICEWSHRFDDLRHRFRTVYVAELAETCLREVLADFRPNLAATRRFQQEMGAGVEQELAARPITMAWRREKCSRSGTTAVGWGDL
jgi:hypothetical protein